MKKNLSQMQKNVTLINNAYMTKDQVNILAKLLIAVTIMLYHYTIYALYKTHLVTEHTI